MTNLEIIKYLAANNPTRLAELLNDICWFARSHDKFLAMGERSTKEIDDFEEWLNEDASKRNYYYDDELEEWSKANTKMVRNCLNCAHLGDPFIWCDACDGFEYWEEGK